MTWSNWSGSVRAPAAVHRPRDEGELSASVRRSRTIRPTGAGHSFMPLCESGDAIVSLEDMAGEITIAADRRTAQIPAGWSIKRLTAMLWEHGLALANQGDVNPQSLAGSMATGTHGTGGELGNLSSFARGFRLIGADGEARWCDATTEPDLFEAQRLSLGLFGVATEIVCDVVPAFHLIERIEKKPWGEIRERYDEMVAEQRHVEFWFFPHADSVILKTLEVCDLDHRHGGDRISPAAQRRRADPAAGADAPARDDADRDEGAQAWTGARDLPVRPDDPVRGNGV